MPTQPQVYVRMNPYERNRAHLIVYNWAEDCSVNVDVSQLRIPAGARYELRSVQDYFGRGLSSVFRGKDLEVPMQGWGMARPIGDFDRELPDTLPRFGAFVLTWRTRRWTDRLRLSSLRNRPVGDLLSQAYTQ